MKKIKLLMILSGVISVASLTACNSGGSVQQSSKNLTYSKSEMYGKEADLKRVANQLIYAK